jgi:diguanylate cyclase (GGDEF)-like protein/PAS domain S-box-containing protein
MIEPKSEVGSPTGSLQKSVVGVLTSSDYRFANNLVQFFVVPTFVIDREGKVLIWNRACEKLTGLPAAEVAGTSDHWRAFYSEARPCLCDLILSNRMSNVEQLYESRAESQDPTFGAHVQNWCLMPRLGTELYLAIDAGPICDDDGNVIAVVETLRDMTAQKRAQDELTRLASHDWLTGLFNRRSFDERLGAEWKRARRGLSALSLLMIDVDRFKLVNDRLGHQTGDECLRSISGVLRQSVSRPTDMVARYGGEEFAVILGSTTLDAALAIAEKIRLEIEQLGISTGAGEGSAVTVSIGVSSTIPDRVGSVDWLVSSADQALYQAKANGRNRVCHFDRLNVSGAADDLPEKSQPQI